MIPHSYEFTELPSERNTEHSKAARVMHRLIQHAAPFGTFGYSMLSDRTKRARRAVERALENGEEVRLVFETQPGAFIEKQSQEDREILRTLTSADLDVICTDPNEVHDWELHPKPGHFSKFGPFVDNYETIPHRFCLSLPTEK